ncbi:MAG: hypothetical protein HFG87_05675 [Dorea sp.]|jgi:hypothetical protein|nr:hypothetical protein [Dorea sp.]MCI9226526.1 hypothetical protein [Dorea sp.]
MSQEKVDRYKKEKANRKENLRREKLHNVMHKCAVCLVGIVLIGWIGYSAYGRYEESRSNQEALVDYSALTNLKTELAEAAQ